MFKNILTQVSRILVGGLFIFSGVIKMNDPVGFGFKLEEYFGEDVLHLPFLQPYALHLAVFLVILEVMLGLFLLLGSFKRFTLWSIAGMMAFFTFLTFYSAYFNKVTDCGCFGDAIPLTPWESFSKDVVLSILIGVLIWGRGHLHPWMPSRLNHIKIASVMIFCLMFTQHVLRHGPVWDFRAYKPGTDVMRAMMSAEDLGLDPPKYETYFTLQGPEGAKVEVSGTDYVADKWYERADLILLEEGTYSKKIAEGYEPPIHDFSIVIEGEDRTEDFVNAPEVLWLIAYDFSKANRAELIRLVKALDVVIQKDPSVKVVGMTASSDEEIAALKAETGCTFPWAIMDGTALKTVQRSNPGVTYLTEGVIQNHWHYNDAIFLNVSNLVWPE
jgi:uncharacterized membrane protein YphA (DoxX/SURF4 family)